jgi:hypothetical protein
MIWAGRMAGGRRAAMLAHMSRRKGIVILRGLFLSPQTL